PVVTIWMYGTNRQPFTGQLAASGLAMAEMLFHLQTIGLMTLIRGFGHQAGPFDLVTWSIASLTVSLGATLVMGLWVITAAWLSSGRTQRLLIVLAVLALSNYGSVALGRAPLVERNQTSLLRWAALTRYHYSATALLAVGLAMIAATLLGKRPAVWARAAL